MSSFRSFTKKLSARHWTAGGLATIAVASVLTFGSPFTASTYNPDSYYVDKDSIGGPCSDAYTQAQAKNDITKPFCTIDAIDTVVPSAGGVRIFVRKGSYPNWLVNAANKTAYVKVRPYQREHVSTTGLEVKDTTHWDFQGFELTGTDGTLPPGLSTGRVFLDNADQFRLVGWNIHDTVAGVLMKSGNTDVTISSNKFTNLDCVDFYTTCPDGNKAGYGFSSLNVGDSKLYFTRNTYTNTDGDGIQLGLCTDCRIDANTFVDVAARGAGTQDTTGNTDHADSYQFSGGAIRTQFTRNSMTGSSKCVISGATARTFDDLLFSENVCVGTGNFCFAAMPDSSNVTIRNNICWDNRYGGVDTSANAQNQPRSGWHIYNNIFGPCDLRNLYSPDCAGDAMPIAPSTSGISSWHHNIIGTNSQNRTFASSDIVGLTQGQIDGMFDNWQTGDYRLPAGSTAVNAGSIIEPVSAFEFRLGKPRQVGTVDIGAYERQVSDP